MVLPAGISAKKPTTPQADLFPPPTSTSSIPQVSSGEVRRLDALKLGASCALLASQALAAAEAIFPRQNRPAALAIAAGARLRSFWRLEPRGPCGTSWLERTMSSCPVWSCPTKAQLPPTRGPKVPNKCLGGIGWGAHLP